MINFRYHLVSLVGLFLALAIGVIFGTAVIDEAVVDRLERQQSSLERRIDEVRTANRRLTGDLHEERAVAQKLAGEGSQRLVNETLKGIPVLLVAARGAESDGLSALVSLLGRADADYEGTLWLSDQFALDNQNDAGSLAAAVASGSAAAPAQVRGTALRRLARSLRPDPAGGTLPPDAVIPALRSAGFLAYDAPAGSPTDVFPVLDPRTRIIAVSGPKAPVPDPQLMLPLVRALVAPVADRAIAPVLAVTGRPPDPPSEDTFIQPLRDDESLAGRLSTVDDIDDFSGRLAAVFALVDLGEGRSGNYGIGPSAERLLPTDS